MISVVVPCFNCEKTLEKCVKSILQQNTVPFEVILVDDGSNDSTGAMCESFAAENKGVRVIHQENRGLMEAWKRGVAESAGEYIAFVDSDDWLEAGFFERLGKFLSENAPDIISFGIEIDYSDGRTVFKDNYLEEKLYTREEIEREIFPRIFSCGSMESPVMILNRFNKLIRRELLSENFHLLDKRFSIGEDDLASFLAIMDAQSLYNIKAYFPYHYFRHTGSMMGGYGTDTINKLIDVKNELTRIAGIKNYKYTEQMKIYLFDNTLVTIKKMLAGNDKEAFENIRKILKKEDIAEVMELAGGFISGYAMSHRVFYGLLKRKQLRLLKLMIKLVQLSGLNRTKLT